MWDETMTELMEWITQNSGKSKYAALLNDPCNFEFKDFFSHDIPVSQMNIKTTGAALLLEKEIGTYITVMTGRLELRDCMSDVCACLAEQLKILLAPYFGGTLCIVGIGNQEIVSDSIGPETIRRIPVKALECLAGPGTFQKLAAIRTDVEQNTNIKTTSIISGIASMIKADCVLLIDASACESYDRLCKTIQLSNTGMRGHLTGNRMDYNEIGVPVVSIGVPTVIPIRGLDHNNDSSDQTFMTVSNITAVVKNAAYAIAHAIIQVAYPELDSEGCSLFVEENLVW